MTSISKAAYYRAYGLSIKSELPCPELVPIGETTPDVVVEYGNPPEKLESPSVMGFKFQANADEVLIETDKIARILVSRGNRIVIQPRPSAQESDIRSLFLGWGMGALLHQRDMLPLHGSAISSGEACAAFCAPSGTGKSSLATLFVKRGYHLLDDNIVAIGYVDGEYKVHPGSPFIKLADSVLQKPEYSFVTPGAYLPALRKYVTNARSDLADRPQPLKKIYILSRGKPNANALEAMIGAPKFDRLMKNVFCLRFIQGTDRLSQQFGMLRSIAAGMPAVEVNLPEWPAPYDHVADLIQEDFSRSVGQPINQAESIAIR